MKLKFHIFILKRSESRR